MTDILNDRKKGHAMAVGWRSLFTKLGMIAARSNDLAEDIELLDSDLYYLQELFEASDQPELVAAMPSRYSSAKSSLTTLRGGLAEIATNVLRDKDTVADELNLTSDALASVLPAFISAMNAESESVQSSTVAIGAVTAGGSNVGSGTILVSGVMDGVSQPAKSVPAHPEYAGVACELSIPETMKVVCTGDSYTDRLTEGAERLSWSGLSPNAGTWDTAREGSGTGPSFVLANATNIITNRDFEIFTSTNTPTGWTLTGTAGTHIFAETSEVFRGSRSLQLTGDGAQATIGVSQAVSVASVTPLRRYNVSVRIKADATIANGDLTIQFEGTGYTAGSSEKIVVAPGSLPTSWTLYNFWINLPSVVPSDFKLVIKWENTPTNTKNLYIDSLAFAPATFHNGVGMVGVAGSTPFVRGDEFTVPVTNTEGVIQQFFRKAFNVQLPSSTSPTQPDSLAG